MALRGQIVDFVRLDFLYDAHQAGRIGEVTVVQGQRRPRLVQFAVQMINAFGIERRGSALQTMDFIAFGEQEFSQIGTILSGDAGDQCALLFHQRVII